MGLIRSFPLLLFGVLLGMLVSGRLGSLIVTLCAIAKETNSSGRMPRLLGAAFLHSGLWLLIAVVVFLGAVHTAPWSTPLLIGVALAVPLVIVITLCSMKRGPYDAQAWQQRRSVRSLY